MTAILATCDFFSHFATTKKLVLAHISKKKTYFQRGFELIKKPEVLS